MNIRLMGTRAEVEQAVKILARTEPWVPQLIRFLVHVPE